MEVTPITQIDPTPGRKAERIIITPRCILKYLQYCNGILSVSSIDNYDHQLMRFHRFAGARPVTGRLLTEYYKALYDGGASPVSVGFYAAVIRIFLNWAVRTELLRKSPYVPPPKMPRTEPKRIAFTMTEYSQLLAAADDYWPIAIRVAWATGLRLGDVAQLKWKSINWADQSLTVNPQKSRRQGKQVQIPLSTELVQILKAHAAAMKEEAPPELPSFDEYVLPDMALEYRRTHKSLCEGFQEIVRRAGIQGKSFHCLRHSFVTRMVEADVNPLIIASMTGHALSEIARYSKPNLEAKRKAMGL